MGDQARRDAETTGAAAAGPARTVQLTVNGELRSVPAPATVASLLQALGLPPGEVAVERNQQLVRRSEHGSTALAQGDRIEIVTFFGGG